MTFELRDYQRDLIPQIDARWQVGGQQRKWLASVDGKLWLSSDRPD